MLVILVRNKNDNGMVDICVPLGDDSKYHENGKNDRIIVLTTVPVETFDNDEKIRQDLKDPQKSNMGRVYCTLKLEDE
jgi:hypothetical protein